MKKTICVILSILILTVTGFAVSNQKKNWYFSSKSQNDRPGLPGINSNIAKGIGSDEKVIYLTFDAGYENGNVKKTVDILHEHQVNGAFFVLSHFVSQNPDLCKKIKQNGNLVCNHTSSHPEIPNLSAEKLKEELTELEKIYKEKTGYTLDPFFRPPKGCYSEESLEIVADAGYKTVFWSLAWEDWDNNNQKPKEFAMKKLLSRVHNGAIILLHPTSKTNCEILGEFIETMKNQGYRFGSLEELWQK